MEYFTSHCKSKCWGTTGYISLYCIKLEQLYCIKLERWLLDSIVEGRVIRIAGSSTSGLLSGYLHLVCLIMSGLLSGYLRLHICDEQIFWCVYNFSAIVVYFSLRHL